MVSRNVATPNQSSLTSNDPPLVAVAALTLGRPMSRRSHGIGPTRQAINAESAPDRVDRRPGRAVAEGGEQSARESLPVGKLVDRVPTPRGDHREDEGPALPEQFVINARIAFADLFGNVSEIELDRPAATRLEVNEQQTVLRAEQVARVRLAVQ